MNQWLANTVSQKRPLPILTLPAASLLGVQICDVVASSDLQLAIMQRVLEETDSPAVLSFMDLSAEAEAFGAAIKYSEDEIPTVFGRIVTNQAEAEALAVPSVGAGRTGQYLSSAERAVKTFSDRPVLAGCIGPFSLAGRLNGVTEIMISCRKQPELLQILLEKVTEFILAYIQAYKDLGAGGVIMAEPLAGMLTPKFTAQYSAPYVKRIIQAVQDEHFIVVYHNCGQGVLRMIDSIQDQGAAAYHFGNAVSMRDVLEAMPCNAVCMGNVDPGGQLYGGTPESVYKATTALLEQCDSYPNFLLSTGCDVPPASPWENIRAFYRAAADFQATKAGR